MRSYKGTLLLVCMLLFAAIFRLMWITTIPHSVNSDELHYLLSAKSLFLTGKDISQTTKLSDILVFHYPQGELVQAELPYVLEMATVGIQPFSLFGNALPNIIFGLLIVIVMYLLTKELFKNDRVALISSFLTAINPWLIMMSRTSYEVIPATLFFLLAFYLLLKAKGWYIVCIFPVLLFAFYSYIATKLIFLPLLAIYISYCYFFVHKRKYTIQYIILFTLSLALMLFFLFQLKHFPQTSRTSEVILPNSDVITRQVDAIRKTTISNPLLALFNNKGTVYIKILVTNTFAIFSPNYLFLQGDYFFSLFQQGIFYPLDAVFLITGSVWVYLGNKRLFLLFVSLCCIAILPQILHYQVGSNNFTPHIALLIPFFIMLMSIGLWKLCAFLRADKRISIMGIVGFVYLFSIGSFITVYFFQLPLQHDFFNFPDRVLAHYITLSQPYQKPTFVYTQDSKSKFEEYVFYNNLLTKRSATSIATALLHNDYTIGIVRFFPCDSHLRIPQKGSLTIVGADCKMTFPQKYVPVTIAQLSDSGGVYRIFNDTVCHAYQLPNYISQISLADFNVTQLSHETFCTKFITSFL